MIEENFKIVNRLVLPQLSPLIITKRTHGNNLINLVLMLRRFWLRDVHIIGAHVRPFHAITSAKQPIQLWVGQRGGMVHLLKMLCEINKKNSITFSKILVIVRYVCRVNQRTLHKSYYRSLSQQSWFYSFKKDTSWHFQLLYSSFVKPQEYENWLFSGTLIDTCITPSQENNPCNRKVPRNCQMSGKRNSYAKYAWFARWHSIDKYT